MGLVRGYGGKYFLHWSEARRGEVAPPAALGEFELFLLNEFMVARNVDSVKDAAALVYERLLILRCQGGDEIALGELIARYSPGLRMFLAKMTSPAAADDLLQETWFDAYRKINRLQRPEAFAAWIYRIARDKAYRQMRRRPQPPTLVEENLAESDQDDDEGFSAEDAQIVRAALDELPGEQREVLMLRFIEEMSYEQIAEVIERPVGTVRSRIHYAKVALRTKLERKEMTS
jgi:RNA polymerase sigma-70 factor (ECF subfamily)